jgi:uroporphyrinogen decarboxylase
MDRIIKELDIPTILFCKGSSVFYKKMASIKPTAISIDWNANLADVRAELPNITLQGNLDPDILAAPDEVLIREVTALLKSMEGDRGYIFNLGHGIMPHIKPESVKLLVETIRCQNVLSS